MNTERLPAYLIDGALIDILKSNRTNQSIAWIVPDENSSSGFRTYNERFNFKHDYTIAGNVTPRDATNGRNVLEDKKQEVAEYLITSFELTEEQATGVVYEAHEGMISA
jgi:hypothetical protein